MTVIQDLPIGVAGGGADAWTWQGVLAEGVSVGAPPDAFNSQGQDWGSPPLVPWRLRDADYEPFVQSIRATIAGAGGLRIDHVMGLFRLWWVPSDGTRRRRRVRPLSGRGPAEHRRAGEPPGAGRSSWARTSAPWRTASARPWPSTACCPTGCSGSRTTTRRSGRPPRWRPSRPTTCPRSRGCGPARTSSSSGSTAPAPRRSCERGRTSLLEHLPGLADGAPGRGGRGARAPAAGAGAVHPAVGHPRRRRRRGAPAEHAGRHRAAQLVAAAARCRWRTCRRTRCCRRSPAPSPTASPAADPRNAAGADTPEGARAGRSVQRQVRTRRRPAPPSRCRGPGSSTSVPGAADERVVAVAAVEDVVAEATAEDVVAVVTRERVVPGAAADDVVGLAAGDDVVAAEAHDHVDAVGADEDVVPVRAGDRRQQALAALLQVDAEHQRVVVAGPVRVRRVERRVAVVLVGEGLDRVDVPVREAGDLVGQLRRGQRVVERARHVVEHVAVPARVELARRGRRSPPSRRSTRSGPPGCRR